MEGGHLVNANWLVQTPIDIDQRVCNAIHGSSRGVHRHQIKNIHSCAQKEDHCGTHVRLPFFLFNLLYKKNKTTQEKHFCLFTEQSAAAQSFENRLPVFPKFLRSHLHKECLISLSQETQLAIGKYNLQIHYQTQQQLLPGLR